LRFALGLLTRCLLGNFLRLALGLSTRRTLTFFTRQPFGLFLRCSDGLLPRHTLSLLTRSPFIFVPLLFGLAFVRLPHPGQRCFPRALNVGPTLGFRLRLALGLFPCDPLRFIPRPLLGLVSRLAQHLLRPARGLPLRLPLELLRSALSLCFCCSLGLFFRLAL